MTTATATPTLQEIPLDQLDPSPFQTRRFPRKPDPELRQLAESIGSVGVLQPILVRPVNGRFEILAGERRVRASRLAALSTIPATVRELDDDVAAEVCVVENLQREDLGAVEQGHAVALLLARDGWTAATVAAEIGRSESWVARRASLWTRLSDGWKEVAGATDHPAHEWPAARLEVVARLDVDDQEALLKKHRNNTSGWFWLVHSSGELQREVDGRLRKLSAAPFKCGDADLVPEAGKCTECPYRASQEHLLFDNVKPATGKGIPKNDRCLRRSCWDEKAVAHFRAEVELARTRFGKDPLLLTGYNAGVPAAIAKGLKQVNRWNVDGQPKKKPFRGSVPALYADPSDSHYGQLLHVKPPAKTRSSSGKTIADKRRELAVKRLREANEAIVAAMREAKRTPKPREIWALAAVIQCFETGGPRWPGEKDDELAAFEEAIGSTKAHNELARHVWSDNVLETLENDAGYCWRPEQGETTQATLTRVAELVGVDTAPIIKAAIDANPEPASWAKKKAKRKPKKKRGKEAAAGE